MMSQVKRILIISLTTIIRYWFVNSNNSIFFCIFKWFIICFLCREYPINAMQAGLQTIAMQIAVGKCRSNTVF